ncbi:sucrose-6-phosphatase [Marchantia polymorpha subsp. ruderalis]|uniref:Sucrose-phosphatase n=2 Tax=Marchantia polymorpha TaxID=3197 RepID=A0AAF6BBT9_MARPO|nr:hypothetical protein MARPO_0787s0001 [Marchantia polymorpha]BBN09473.1 hypothetical protein Mp_4g19980 [Marchantia polymorpha subsp. ruderalis]|eukprot:PTQ26633.1 hypothetical protein MARPO_0787s0001 [Marchantia polymorpha]
MEVDWIPEFMIVSDLDNTMVDHKDPDYTSLLRFDALWEAYYRMNSLLVFSTGRSQVLYNELRSEVPLLTPGIAIMSVGTEIRYGDTMEEDKGWVKELDVGWNRSIIVEEAEKLNLKFQCESEQRPHKVSFHVTKEDAPEVIKKLTEAYTAHKLKFKFIYSGGIDLDVLPEGAGKGQALAYLLKQFKIKGTTPKNTLVCGDSGNDAELFEVADVHGVIVGNAQEELLQWHEQNAKSRSNVFLATERCAAGIIQAMQHFNFTPNISPRDLPTPLIKEATPEGAIAVAHEIVEFQLLFERWFKGAVENSDEVFQRLKATLLPECVLVNPWGVQVKPLVAIEMARPLYGSLKGKNFRIWIDRIRINQISEEVWAVQFDKWLKSDKELSCRLTSGLLKKKDGTPNGVAWLHIHETWLLDYAGPTPRYVKGPKSA